MQTIDFQALASSSRMTLKAVNGTLNSRAAGKGSEQSAFSRTLQRCERSNRSDTGEINTASSENVSRGTKSQEKNYGAGNAPEAQAPVGKEASQKSTEAGQLEVKDENGNSKDVNEEQAVQSQSSDSEDVSEEVEEALENVATEIQELIAGLQAMAQEAVAGASGEETSGEDSDKILSGAMQQGLEDIMGDVEDLEQAILKLSQALKEENTGNAAPASDSDPESEISKLMLMINGNKVMIKAKISEGNEEKGQGNSKVEGGRGGGNQSLHLMIKASGRSNSESQEQSGTTEGDADEQSSQTDTANGVKKIMMIENHKLNMFKVHVVEDGEKTSDNAATDTTAVKTTSMDGQLASSVFKTVDDASLALNGKDSDKSVDPKQLIDQIVKKFELLTKPESSEIKIQLKPEFLGKMTIKLSMEDGVLSAKFVTDNHQVKSMLESNLALFKQQLEAAGIKVEKTEVSVQLSGGTDYNSMTGDQQGQWQFSDQAQASLTRSSGVYQDGYADYSNEDLETAVINSLNDEVNEDSSVSYLV